jgi:hypothetical protein
VTPDARLLLLRAGRRLDKASGAAAALGESWPPTTDEERRLARTRSDALHGCLADLKLACLIARVEGVELAPGHLMARRARPAP